MKIKKSTRVMEVFLILCQLFPSSMLVVASARNDKAKVNLDNEVVHKDHSSNQISVKDEEKLKLGEEQLYYLPTQTVFDITETLKAGGVSTTSPPHLTINPAPIQTSYTRSTTAVHESSSDEIIFNSDSFPSQCVSETPVAELRSQFLLPSESLLKESVIMSGHVEIASKTSTNEDLAEINNIVSQPSIALQGTILHSHSVTDL